MLKLAPCVLGLISLRVGGTRISCQASLISGIAFNEELLEAAPTPEKHNREECGEIGYGALTVGFSQRHQWQPSRSYESWSSVG